MKLNLSDYPVFDYDEATQRSILKVEVNVETERPVFRVRVNFINRAAWLVCIPKNFEAAKMIKFKVLYINLLHTNGLKNNH